MNISAKTEYACLAVLELAANYGTEQPIRVRAIADSTGVPSNFLVQILLQLKAAGLVNSTRGAAGGYQLIRDPAEVTLAEVMAVVDRPAGELTSSATQCTPGSRALLSAWTDVHRAQREMLEAITFGDLLERVRGETERMFYI